MKALLQAACRAACLLVIAAYAAPALAAGPAGLAPTQALLGSGPDATSTELFQTFSSPAPAQPVGPAIAIAKAAVPLRDLVIAYVNRGVQDAEQECLATAVYFEARSEPLEGQLAVARVILNRAASGVYPPGICEVVRQPAQFSFVRGGRMPPPDKTSDWWHRALAIADIARSNATAGEIAGNVLWYHATYVSPSWGRQRTRITQIGKHVFFS